MIIKSYYEEQLVSILEWNDTNKTLTLTMYHGNGDVDYIKIIEGCNDFETAKKFLKN